MSRLIRVIPGSFEEVSALCGVEETADVAESLAKGLEGSCGLLLQHRLKLWAIRSIGSSGFWTASLKSGPLPKSKRSCHGTSALTSSA